MPTINVNTVLQHLPGTVLEIIFVGLFFTYVMPKIKGAKFNGGFWDGIAFGALYQLVFFAVGLGLIAAFIVASFLTLGGALLLVPYALLFGIWFVPALALKALSWLAPKRFEFTSGRPLLVSGLIICVILIAVDLGCAALAA